MWNFSIVISEISGIGQVFMAACHGSWGSSQNRGPTRFTCVCFYANILK